MASDETASDARKNEPLYDMGKAFCAEQLRIDPEWCRVIKECEKAVMRNAHSDSSTHELIAACSSWFTAAYMLQESRRAREEAWKAEFTGRKVRIRATVRARVRVRAGTSVRVRVRVRLALTLSQGDLHKIFDQIDKDGDGTINLEELQAPG